MDERTGVGGAVGGSREIRCPSCSRLLVLRSGPAITAHFAHRPRQSCRRRPGRSPITPLRLEQLTLFDPAALDPPILYPPPDPAEDGLAELFDDEMAWTPASVPNRSRRRRRLRRRRRAWLPGLIRWIKSRPGR